MGLDAVVRPYDLGKGYSARLEYETTFGNLHILKGDTEIAKYTYQNGALIENASHGGKPLPGIDKRAAEKLSNKISSLLKKMVTRSGGQWNKAMAIKPPVRGGVPGGLVAGAKGCVMLFFSIMTICEDLNADEDDVLTEAPLPPPSTTSFDDNGLKGSITASYDANSKPVISGQINPCKDEFKPYAVESGDSCYCLWQKRTNKSISWTAAYDECKETCTSRNPNKLKEGETICVPK